MIDNSNLELPLVSVIMPNYNNARYIYYAIDGVLNQSYKKLELTIVDDGSTDSSVEIANKIASSDSRVKIIQHSKNMGVAAALNTGLKNSQGDLIGFCASDDVWLLDKIKIQMVVLNDNTDIGVVHADSLIIDESGNLTGDTFNTFYKFAEKKKNGFILHELMTGNYISAPTVLMRRTLMEEIGQFPENIKWLEDWIYMLRLANRCKFAYLQQPLAKYRVHQNSSCHDLVGYEASRITACQMVLKEFDISNKNIKACLYKRIGRGLLGLRYDGKCRKYFVKALMLNPFDIKTIAYYISSYFMWSKYISYKYQISNDKVN